MGEGTGNEPATTTVEAQAECGLVVTRRFAGPPRLVFEAWTSPDLLKQWWAPKSMGVPLRSCAVDVRAGGRYRFEFGHDAAQSMAFFGQYVEVVRPARLVWTNEESDAGAVTTVTFTEEGGGTRLVLHELYPTATARDEALAGMTGGVCEQYAQLDDLLLALGASASPA